MSPQFFDYFMDIAKVVSTKSKDPSTKVGAVIARPDRTIASVGYNGFPRGCRDDPELYANREIKYQRIIHAEMNALLSAREPLDGFILITWPLPPCDRCIPHIIQAGIRRVVAPEIHDGHRWKGSCGAAVDMAKEAGLVVVTWSFP